MMLKLQCLLSSARKTKTCLETLNKKSKLVSNYFQLINAPFANSRIFSPTEISSSSERMIISSKNSVSSSKIQLVVQKLP